MRRKDREISNQSEIELILDSAEVCRIGMYDGTYPYVLPVNFVFKNRKKSNGEDSGKGKVLYFHSAKAGKKTEILKKHPRVCIEIDDPGQVIDNGAPCDAAFTYKSIVAVGTAALCTEDNEIGEALEMITEKYLGRGHTFNQQETASVHIYKVTLSKITGKAAH